MTTQELFDKMKKGDIEAYQLLTKLDDKFREIARRNGALTKALSGPQAKLNQLQTKWQQFLIKAGESGAMDLIVNLFDNLGKGIDILSNALGPLVSSLRAVKELIVAVVGPLTDFPLTLTAIVAGVGTLAFALKGMLPVLGSFLMRWAIIPTAIILAIAALQSMVRIMKGEDSIFREWAKQDGILAGFARWFVIISEGFGLVAEGIAGGAFTARKEGETKEQHKERVRIANEAMQERANRIRQTFYAQELANGSMSLVNGVPVSGSMMQLVPSIAEREPLRSEVKPSPTKDTVDITLTFDGGGFKAAMDKSVQSKIDQLIVKDQSSLAGRR